MPPNSSAIAAVCFDFFNTLADLKDGIGRGRRIREYFEASGLESDPWDHRVLYDVFQPDTPGCTLGASAEARSAYLHGVTDRLFARLNVTAPGLGPAEHAEKLWKLLGPDSFVVFPESLRVLARVRDAGIPVAVVSNWPCGLGHLCAALGIKDQVDHIVCSGELGIEKPDRRIFEEACRRLGAAPGRTLHVGDTVLDDLEGASAAGLQAVLIQRSAAEDSSIDGAITDLVEVLPLLGLDPE